MIHICGAEIVSLHEKKCIPCQGGIPPLTTDQIKPFMEQIDNDWNLIADHHIERVFTFDDFQTALILSMRLGKYAKLKTITQTLSYLGVERK